MSGWRLVLGVAMFGLTGAARPMSPPPTITDVHAITLHGGVNRVPGFLPGGGAATIVQAWRDNGNAHGYYVWMVVGDVEKYGQAPLVIFEGETLDPADSTVSASPFDGERVTDDVRFATVRIAGKPASLAIRADLDEAPSGVTADHATATIRWYRLVHRDDDIGEAPNAFVEIGSLRTTKRYCNVDLALRDTANIPLPLDFAGANRADGCFPGG
ncbi:hypothetical protein [uncultured Sphingomonas sp.]|uniref:hypothetical protein n=1 Tax=uncultured Sphingomonas sp. TaxID=158754 RepID=UPI0035CB5CE8